MTYIDQFFSGGVDPSVPHIALILATVFGGALVGGGIVWESIRAGHLWTWPTWLVIVGVLFEAAATVTLFEFDEGISHAQQANLIALQSDNLALQTVLLPRHVGLIGLDEEPRAKKWFAGIDRYRGTYVAIQVVSGDREAANLANEIGIVLSKFGWRPQLIAETRSGIKSDMIPDGVSVSYPSSGKAYTGTSEPWFAWHDAAEILANDLTKAGLGVGNFPVSRFGFIPDNVSSNMGAHFGPPLEGVYVQVGSRPVAMTLEWLAQRRKAAHP